VAKMSLLVVGGDRLGKIRENLKERRFDKIMHVTGRKKVKNYIQYQKILIWF
jgi:hypothetical protein